MRLFHTPSFSHLLSLRLAVESSPYFFGTSIHLHPVIRTKSTAFTVDLSSALGLPSFAPGGSRGSILLHSTSSISSNFIRRRGCQTIISISRPRELDKGVSIEIGSVVETQVDFQAFSTNILLFDSAGLRDEIHG